VSHHITLWTKVVVLSLRFWFGLERPRCKDLGLDVKDFKITVSEKIYIIWFCNYNARLLLDLKIIRYNKQKVSYADL